MGGLAVAGALCAVGRVSMRALQTVLLEGAPALLVLLGAAGLGLWLLSVLRLNDAPPRWRFLAAVGLGLGCLSVLVLVLGLLGLLDRTFWTVLLVVCTLGGALHAANLRRRFDAASQTPTQPDGWFRWLWLGCIGFAALALLAATMPPGILWPEEGNGYDVLEYHLGVPREYSEAGRISYLPHNIYSNFPFNVEMLYLLCLVLRGDAVQAVFGAQLLNAFLAAGAVAGVWLAGREFGRGSGTAAGLLAASAPLLTYLCGVAYVENGLLMFAALAMAAVLRAVGKGRRQQGRWGLLAGLLAGFACGCKYPAVAMVALPLGLAVIVEAFRHRPRKLLLPAAFFLATTAAFSPWLIKNAVLTGNPVFPLARGVFPERTGVWTDEAAARWHEGHLPAPEDRMPLARIERLWSEVLWSGLFGPVVLLAMAIAPLHVVRGAVSRSSHPPEQSRDREGAVNVYAHEQVCPDAHRDGGAAYPLAAQPLAHARGFDRSEMDPACALAAHSARTSLLPCWLMLATGAIVWLCFTHLQGRFAVVLIVSAATVVGASWTVLRRRIAKATAACLLVAIVGFGFRTTAGLFSRDGISYLAMEVFGLADLFTSPQSPWPHIPRLNQLADGGQKVLMVGDARRFYLDRGIDYCVVFSSNPFAEAAARLTPHELIDWLAAHGYDFVYVDWSEMHRLRSTRYGFWPFLDAALFERLSEAGLLPVEHFTIPGRTAPYSTLFATPYSPATTACRRDQQPVGPAPI